MSGCSSASTAHSFHKRPPDTARELQAQLAAQARDLVASRERLAMVEQAGATRAAAWAALVPDATEQFVMAVCAHDPVKIVAAAALGANLEKVSPRMRGKTALMFACHNGSAEMVAALLGAGASKWAHVVDAQGVAHTARTSTEARRAHRHRVDDILELLDESLRPPHQSEELRNRRGRCTLTGDRNSIFAIPALSRALEGFLTPRERGTLLMTNRRTWSIALHAGGNWVGQLRLASTAGRSDSVRRLLAGGAIVDGRGSSDETALMRACRAGRVDIARLLLRAGAAKLARAGWRGGIPAAAGNPPRRDTVYFAELAEDPAMRRALLELLDASRRPPMWHEGLRGRRTLTGSGGVLDAVAPALLPFLDKAEQFRLASTCRSTWRCVPAGLTAEEATRVRRGSHLWWSILGGWASNDDSGAESSLLAWAARRGNAALVSELAEWRADLSAASKDGRTALSEALVGGHLAVATELVARGASVNAPDDLNIIIDQDELLDTVDPTPLVLAISGGFIAFAHELIRRGANVNARAANGFEPALAKAVHAGDVDLVRALLAAGAKLDTTFTYATEFDPVDLTPLRLASCLGRAEIVRVLLAAGAVDEVEGPTEVSILGDAFEMAGQAAPGTRAAVLAALQGR